MFLIVAVMPLQSRQQVKVVTTDLKKHPHLEVKELVAEITSASGKKVPVKLTPTPDGKAVLVDFIPTEAGENQLNIRVGDQPIPNQPQKFTVTPNADPSKVKVEGPGLTTGEVGVPAKFRIDTRKAGVAPVGLGINGPAEAKIETVDNKDGTVDVTYYPVEPGDYELNVTFGQQPVNGTPFKARIVPKGGPQSGPDLTGIKIHGPGVEGIAYLQCCSRPFLNGEPPYARYGFYHSLRNYSIGEVSHIKRSLPCLPAPHVRSRCAKPLRITVVSHLLTNSMSL